MITKQCWANFLVEMATLCIAVGIYSLHRICLSIPMLYIFVLSFLLGDLAVVLYLCELAFVTHGKVFSVKFEADPDNPPYFVPVLI